MSSDQRALADKVRAITDILADLRLLTQVEVLANVFIRIGGRYMHTPESIETIEHLIRVVLHRASSGNADLPTAIALHGIQILATIDNIHREAQKE